MSSAFDYWPLSSHGREIRLLQFLPDDGSGDLRCVLENVQLDDCGEYVALSYTWGDDQLTRHVIIDGQFFPVTENLYIALRQLRSALPERWRWWIDAICINQASVGERNQQVPLMTEIYRKAEATCVWLGEEYENSNLAIDLASWLFEFDFESQGATNERFKAIVDDPAYERYFRSVYHLYCRPYFKRLWVIQEMLAAEKILTFCGSNRAVYMTHLLKIAQLITWELDASGFPESSQRNPFLAEIEHVRPVQCLWVDMKDNIVADFMQRASLGPGRKPQPALMLVMKYRKQLCKNPRDKIYGICGLMASVDGRKLTVDYSLSVVEVYVDFAEYVVSTSGKLNIICLANNGMAGDDFPSWVPDWRHGDRASRSLFLPVLEETNYAYSAAGDSQAVTRFSQGNRVLTAKGFLLSRINNIAQNVAPSEVKTKKLCLIFENWLRLALQSFDYEYLTEDDKAKVLDDFWRTIITDRAIIGTKAPKTMGQSFHNLLVRCGVADDLANIATIDEVRYEDFISEADEYTGLVILALVEWKFLTVTSNTVRMGVASANAQEGDLLCLLLGCDFPIVLREVNDHYIVIGEAYVHGCMNGEAFRELSPGNSQLQDFTIR